MKTKNKLIALILMCIGQPSTAALKGQLVPVKGFTLERYLGTWYEMARLPASFEKGLEKVTATYSLKPNGTVKVDNRGMRKGRESVAIGKAKFAGQTDIGFLKVSFFGPFYADYKIIELDTAGYEYALVASSYNYLWILSRKPQLDAAIMDALIKKSKALGFDTGKLFFTPQ